MAEMWEEIEMEYSHGACSDRLAVPGGWIVRSYTATGSYSNSGGVHQIFIEDKDHKWEIEKRK